MAEINQWVTYTSELNSDITATRTLWDTLIHTKVHGTDSNITMQLPLSQHKMEMGTFTSGGFSNLEAATPWNEKTERTLVLSLIQDLNELFSSGLCTNPVIDRFMEDEVFGSDAASKQPLILIGVSHLNRIAGKLDTEKWEIFNLSRPRFQVSKSNVTEITAQVVDLGKSIQLENSTAVLQLYDNSIFQVGGPGGVRHLPKPDFRGHYHIDGTLQIADKAAVKEMMAMLSPC
jgi:hypothetical protein